MKQRRCEFLDTVTARARDTPSYTARNCPGALKPGKKKGASGGPQMYESRAVRQCSRLGGCRTVWKWVRIDAPAPPVGRVKIRRGRTGCEFQDTKSARARSTPSYSAKECPWSIRAGKTKGPGGGPQLYISKPVRSCSRRGLGCKVTWRWTKYS